MNFTNYSQCLLHEASTDWFECCVEHEDNEIMLLNDKKYYDDHHYQQYEEQTRDERYFYLQQHCHQEQQQQQQTNEKELFKVDKNHKLDENEEKEEYPSIKNPFSEQNLIPLPEKLEEFNSHENQHFIRRRNERERTRVRNVNDGFERLRQHLPMEENRMDKRLSKVETLRLAISYIRHLERILRS